MMNAKRLILASAILFGMEATSTAYATPLTGQEVLTQFNLVTIGNDTSYSHVDGRSYVGGNVIGSGAVFAMHPGSIAASNYAGLTVAGSANGLHVDSNGAVILGSLTNSIINSGTAAVLGSAANDSFNGAAYIAGAAANNNYNGGHLSSAPSTVAAATSTNFAGVLSGLSNNLKQLSATGSSLSSNGYGRETFNAVANTQGLAVFNLNSATASQVFSSSEFEFNLGSASTVVINVDASSLNFSTNFLNGSAQQIAGKVIWNFYDATSLTIGNQFGGAILAPNAILTNYNNIEGSVLVDKLTQYGEIHAATFTGNVSSAVPEPAEWALMMFAFPLLLLRKQVA